MITFSQSSYLALNAGSSSIRFAVFNGGDLKRIVFGKLDRIGISGTYFSVSHVTDSGVNVSEYPVSVSDYEGALSYFFDVLEEQIDFSFVKGIGHRVVHGMNSDSHVRITPELLVELHRNVPFAPEHLPQEIALIETCADRHNQILQVACFDTIFHRSMPKVAQLLPLPQQFEEKGMRRYGFHGLSYEYLMEEILSKSETNTHPARVILAHLGNGVSMTACKNGKSVDTSMGFTPLSGLPMGTRSGDLDPGALLALLQEGSLSEAELSLLLNHESGLLGISGMSSNMLDLLQAEDGSERAHLAVEYFCYQAKKYIGAYSAVLGGLDELVFTGGMGQNSEPIRRRICEGLELLGIKINDEANRKHEPIISQDESKVVVRVIPADEEVMIARTVKRFSDILS